MDIAKHNGYNLISIWTSNKPQLGMDTLKENKSEL